MAQKAIKTSLGSNSVIRGPVGTQPRQVGPSSIDRLSESRIPITSKVVQISPATTSIIPSAINTQPNPVLFQPQLNTSRWSPNCFQYLDPDVLTVTLQAVAGSLLAHTSDRDINNFLKIEQVKAQKPNKIHLACHPTSAREASASTPINSTPIGIIPVTSSAEASSEPAVPSTLPTSAPEKLNSLMQTISKPSAATWAQESPKSIYGHVTNSRMLNKLLEACEWPGQKTLQGLCA